MTMLRQPEQYYFDFDEDFDLDNFFDLDEYFVQMHAMEFHEDLIEFLSLSYQYWNGTDCMLFEGIRCEYWIERSINTKSINKV